MKEAWEASSYIEEILSLIKGTDTDDAIREALDDYHYNDIAEAFELMDDESRERLYDILGAQEMAQVFAFIEDAGSYIGEFPPEEGAAIIQEMDADDAVDVLEDIDDDVRQELIEHMEDDEAVEDIRLISSYDEDEIGSRMTTNFIEIYSDSTIKQAMRELIRQAEDNDNIATIYVKDREEHFYGAIELKDLIVARNYMELDSIVIQSYPYVIDHELVEDCIEKLKDYAEDSIPVLDKDGCLLGVITSQDIVEAVDDEMGDDYAKLAGLTEEEDMEETLFTSIKKRLPWLVVLLFLGMVVSSVVGLFEAVVAKVAIVVCFQSLILDMAGNVGTQSLAVTIRVLMDEKISGRDKFRLVMKEVRIGFVNGLILGTLSFCVIGVYVMMKGYGIGHAFCVSGCVGFSLLVAMMVSAFMGTVIPMIFHKINIDPAVASGPLITTVNDLVAVVTYYGLSWLILINLLSFSG